MTAFATDVSPIVLDVETAPLLNARDFIEPPDVDDISAPANYKDPAKIEAYIEDAKVKRLADFEEDCDHKAALDFNCARIVAIGYWTEILGVRSWLCRDELEERIAIDQLWDLMRQRMVTGFRVREFDIPMLIQRSRFLDIPHPLPDLGRFARGNGITDLYDLLTFNGLRGEQVMRQTVKAFAKRFGIPVDDEVSGGDIPALVAAGEWEKVRQHVESDVRVETAIAKRLGIVRSDVPMAAGF